MSERKLDASEMLLDSLKGLTVASIDHYAEDSWSLSFGSAGLNIGCPWRIVSGDRITLGGSDHGQKFGLPRPVDVQNEALRLLGGKPVEGANIDETTADLRISFADGVRVDVFNDSSGYEGWTFGDQRGLKLVAQGGGQVAIWKPLETKS
jgi:hypothetical protein